MVLAQQSTVEGQVQIQGSRRHGQFEMRRAGLLVDHAIGHAGATLDLDIAGDGQMHPRNRCVGQPQRQTLPGGAGGHGSYHFQQEKMPSNALHKQSQPVACRTSQRRGALVETGPPDAQSRQVERNSPKSFLENLDFELAHQTRTPLFHCRRVIGSEHQGLLWSVLLGALSGLGQQFFVLVAGQEHPFRLALQERIQIGLGNEEFPHQGRFLDGFCGIKAETGCRHCQQQGEDRRSSHRCVLLPKNLRTGPAGPVLPAAAGLQLGCRRPYRPREPVRSPICGLAIGERDGAASRRRTG